MSISTDGLWGFLSAIIGALLGGAISIVSQIFLAKSNAKADAKKILAGKMTDILTYTKTVDRAITFLNSFSNMQTKDEDAINTNNEVFISLKRFIPEAVSQWDNYRQIIYLYFQNALKQKNFIIFEEIMGYLSFFQNTFLNPFSLSALTVDMLKYNQEEIKSLSSKLKMAKDFNEYIQEEYFKKFR